MRHVAKLASTAFFSIFMLGASLSVANALQVLKPVADDQAGGRPSTTAYTDDGESQTAQEASVLSPSEVRHIRWCAARYNLAYDPVSDTYNRGSTNFPCLSPR